MWIQESRTYNVTDGKGREGMKRIRLFSTKAIKTIEGEEAELYINFYLVLSRKCIFTFLIDSPNLACRDRHPIKLWKHFLILFEEEHVKYLRRYENCRKRGRRIYITCRQCKYNYNGECYFYAMGSGNETDMPCYREKELIKEAADNFLQAFVETESEGKK